MTAQIKITQLTEISTANLNANTFFPVVNMSTPSAPVTQKVALGNMATYLISGGSDIIANTVTANYFYGDGSNIANLPVGNIASLNLNGNASTYLAGDGNFTPVTTQTGNIGNINLDGNATNVLSGLGTWVSATSLSLPLANGSSYINIPIVDQNVEISVNGHFWVFGSDAKLTTPGNINATNIVASGSFIGDGSGLSNIAAGNVTGLGNIATINLNGNGSTVLLGNGVFSSVTLSGDGGNISNINGSNVSSEVSFAATANSVAVGNVSGIGNIATINLNGNANTVLQGDGTWGAGGGGGGGTSLPYLELTNIQIESLFTGSSVNFIKTNNGSEVDTIAANVAITRGTNNGIYNPLEEVSWNQSVSPVNTLWNSDGWNDLANVDSRVYLTFYEASGSGQLGYNVVGTEYIMKDTINNTYYTIKFSHWTQGGEGGGIQYERKLINTEIYFTKTDYGNQVDNIGANVAITRGNNNGIYNPLIEVSWDQTISPENTLWNADGWNGFTNFTIADRIYAPFYVAVNAQLGYHVTGSELIMYDTVNSVYYAVMFTSWTPGNNGGGFSYTRRLLNTPQTGIMFSDGTVQNTAFDLSNLPSMPVKYNFMNPEDENNVNIYGQAVFDNQDNELKLSPIALNGINQYEYYDYIYGRSLNSVIKVTSTVDPSIYTQYNVTSIIPSPSSDGYRDFVAGINRLYGSGDPNINQLIITRWYAQPTYSNDGNTNTDNFTASSITGTDMVAMVNIYGSSTNNPISINSLLTFFQEFVDTVIYAGGVSVASPVAMQEAFYNNIDVLEAALPSGSLYQNFEFFTSEPNYTSVANTGGTGTGFALDVTASANGTYAISITNPGTSYTAADVITVLGTALGGASPANDLTITVNSVGGSGEVLTYTLSGTPNYTVTEWPVDNISDGGSDQYDNGNYLNTNLGTNVPYNLGQINTSSAFAGGFYFVAFKGSIFAMIAQCNSSLNTVYYSGGLGADGSGFEKPRALYLPKSYDFTVQTLNTNGYVNYQWGTQWYVEVDLNGTGTGNIVFDTANTKMTTTSGDLYIGASGNNATWITNSNGYSLILTGDGNVAVDGNLSVVGNIFTDNIRVGYLTVPQIAASNTTIPLSASGKHYYSTTNGNITLTIPDNANVAFPTGTAVTVVVQANGNVLINAISGVNLFQAGSSIAGNRVISAYGMATMMKVATDTWFINGTGVS